MKKLKVLLCASAMFIMSGCGLISSLTDVTTTANQLLGSIDDIVRQIDESVQNGDLTEEVGNLIDERLENLADILQETIQNSGGFLFDQANGTINNIFANISALLDQIKQGILDDSLPTLIHQLSTELQAQINLLSSNIEDIIVLAFGNTFILIDKTTNSVVIIASVILLALGLFVFALVLFSRKNRKLNAARIIGLSFMGLYIVFFLLMIFSFRIRGNIIAGFNYGSKYQGTQLTPAVTNLFPEKFVIGKNDKIFIYGKHLNLVKKLSVTLNTNNVSNFTFPENTIIVKSANRIVLGNFGTLNWRIPSFNAFRREMSPALGSLLSGGAFITYSNNINNKLYEAVAPPQNLVHNVVLHNLVHEGVPMPVHNAALTHAGTVTLLNASEAIRIREQQAASIFGGTNGALLERTIKEYYLRRFLLPEGDYGLVVHDSTVQVESPQLLTIFNPPPPVVPDIYPIDITWSGGQPGIQGQENSIDIVLGFAHPEQDSVPFTIYLTTVPNVKTETITVPLSVIESARISNTAMVRSGMIKPTSAGNLNFRIIADYNSAVGETNEGNNELNKNLPVMSYVYDAAVTYISFVSTENMDNGDEDEYTIYCRTSVTGYNDWSFSVDKDGEPGKTFSLNQTQQYQNLRPGQMIVLYTSGHERDSGFRDGDDGMGERNKVINITDDISGGGDSLERSYELIAQSYKVQVRINFMRRISQ